MVAVAAVESTTRDRAMISASFVDGVTASLLREKTSAINRPPIQPSYLSA